MMEKVGGLVRRYIWVSKAVAERGDCAAGGLEHKEGVVKIRHHIVPSSLPLGTVDYIYYNFERSEATTEG